MTNNIFFKNNIFLKKQTEVNSIIKENAFLPNMVFKDEYFNYNFFDFDYIFTEFFWESIQKYLMNNHNKYFTFFVINPHPERYFFKKFGDYGFVDFSEDYSYEMYLDILNHFPRNGSEADVMNVSSKQILIYTQDLKLVIYADRSWETGVLASSCKDLSIKQYFENDLSSVNDFAKSSVQFFGQLNDVNFKLNDFFNSLIANYG